MLELQKQEGASVDGEAAGALSPGRLEVQAGAGSVTFKVQSWMDSLAQKYGVTAPEM